MEALLSALLNELKIDPKRTAAKNPNDHSGKTDFTTANPKTVNTGDIFKIDAGNLKVQLD